MSYKIMSDGHVYAYDYDGEIHVGRIDSDGDWRPEDEYDDLEEYVRFSLRHDLLLWASGDNSNDWTPSAALLIFAHVKTTVEDWDAEKREWRQGIAQRIIATADEREKYHAGLIEL